MKSQKQLLSVIELGGYPDFSDIYQACGFNVTTVTSVRKAIRTLKELKPAVVVAEFNFQSDFRDRTSSLESLLSTMQGLGGAEMVVFYEQEYRHQLARLEAQFTLHTKLAFPIDTQCLRDALLQLSQAE